ncbi:MAG: hypothetical protein D6699_02615 [Aquificota bacterium]|nr:MAG: hypothetical protein D6699_02615 [Aquificota bacterium]
MESLKQLLLKCEVYLKEGNWDALISTLSQISEEHIKGLTLEEAQECIRIIEHLTAQGESLRFSLAESLANLRRFKDAYGRAP